MAVPGVKHLGLKFLSIAVAGLLWFVISGQQIAERALRIPLEYSNLPRDLEMTGETPMVVDVRVRGSSAALSRLSPGELVAVMDLQTARPGRRLFHLTAADVRSPFGIDVVQVTPSNVSVNVETSGTKTVPVVPDVEGEPAAGHQVGTITAEPATVEVIGPISAIKELTRAMTEPVSVDGASAPVREAVNVGVPDPAVRLRTPLSAIVMVDIIPAPNDRTVANVAVSLRGGRGSVASLKPSQVTVAVRGSRDRLDGLRSAELEASVDVAGLTSGQYQLPVRVIAPARIQVVRVDPARVQVSVR